MGVADSLPTPALDWRNYAIAARFDWLALIVVSFPEVIILPVSYLFAANKYALLALPNLLMSSAQALSLFLILTIIAIIVDRIRGMFGPKAQAVAPATADRLIHDFRNRSLDPVADLVCSMWVAPQDTSVGAHVRGVLRPRIVISGGMLVALLRKNGQAESMLFHEVAHVRHGDRLLLGYIGLTVLEAAGTIYMSLSAVIEMSSQDAGISVLLLLVLSKCLMLIIICSFVSKYREYYADGQALQWSADRSSYETLLENTKHARGIFSFFFHPSLRQRLLEIRRGHVVLSRAIFWKVFWVSQALLSCFLLIYVKKELTIDQSIHYASSLIVAVVFLILEIFRKPVFMAAKDSKTEKIARALIPGPRTLRYVFFIFATLGGLYITAEYGGDLSWLWAVLGGILIGMAFRFMRPKTAVTGTLALPKGVAEERSRQLVKIEARSNPEKEFPASAAQVSQVNPAPKPDACPIQSANLAPVPCIASLKATSPKRSSIQGRGIPWAASGFISGFIGSYWYNTSDPKMFALFAAVVTAVIYVLIGFVCHSILVLFRTLFPGKPKIHQIPRRSLLWRLLRKPWEAWRTGRAAPARPPEW